jgi:hypothetical protein
VRGGLRVLCVTLCLRILSVIVIGALLRAAAAEPGPTDYCTNKKRRHVGGGGAPCLSARGGGAWGAHGLLHLAQVKLVK